MLILQALLEAALISSACSTDCFVTGFAYGTNKIKIPFISAVIINLICSAIIGLSLFLGSVIGKYIPKIVTLIICVTILTFLGLSKIFNSYIKNLIRKKQEINKEFKFSLFSLQFLLNISANPENADTDKSKVLSIKEAVPLAVALSLDGLAIGLGAGMTGQTALNYIVIVLLSLCAGVLFLLTGHSIGNKIAKKTSLNLEWLSGVLLIGLALMKIFL